MDSVATMMDYVCSKPLTLKHMLHLTDFSPCSEAALAWAIGLARANGAKLSVLHVVVPDPRLYVTADSAAVAYDLQESKAQEEIRRIEQRLSDLPHDVSVVHSGDFWTAVDKKLHEHETDLVVLGTHGLTGLQKVLMGSGAETVVRKSRVPVITVGPVVGVGRAHHGAFHRVLLATDFGAGAFEAASFAISLALGTHGELTLLHVCTKGKGRGPEGWSLSVAEAMHRLHETIAGADRFEHRPELMVEFGDPAAKILQVARDKKAELIVMGIRTNRNVFAATHLGASTTHHVIAEAPCPVLTVRPQFRSVT